MGVSVFNSTDIINCERVNRKTTKNRTGYTLNSDSTYIMLGGWPGWIYFILVWTSEYQAWHNEHA